MAHVGKPWAANDAHDLEGFKVTRKLRTVIVAGEGGKARMRASNSVKLLSP